MKTNLPLLVAVLLGVVSTVRAESVDFNNVPAAVQKTINSQVGAAGIASIQRLTRNGIPLYEVRLSQGNRKAIYVSETGSLINSDSLIASKPPQDQSHKTTFDKLPAAVQNTVRGQAGTAPIDGMKVVTRNGQTSYNAAFKREGKTVDLWVDAQGKILSGGQTASVPETRAQLSAASKVTLDQVPPAVQNTLRSYSGGAAIEDIDKGTLQGRTVYEAAFKHNGENTELRVAEDGSLVRDDVNDKYLTKVGRLPGSSQAGQTPIGVQSSSSLPVPDWRSAPARMPLSAASKVSFRQLPTAVRDTLRKYSGGATIEDVDKGTVGGQTVYEAAFKSQNQNVELRVAENGTIINDQDNNRFLAQAPQARGSTGRAANSQTLGGAGSIDRSTLTNPRPVTFGQLPSTVQETVRGEAGVSSIGEIHQGTLDGKLVYDVTLDRNGQKVIVRVADDGSVLGSQSIAR